MEHAIRGLQLQRKVVLVASQTGKHGGVTKRDGDETAAWIEVFVGIDNCGANLVCIHPCRVGSKITSKEPALAADHMTFRAFRLAEEQDFSLRRTSRQ